ncbi:helix-turn-helix domain-containing protein [Paenibacillus massiliensis]|uniref:helix-turn-helix domain-containing protein n=1 Tax=Paenibacillus massiliensis TaxID=225917 RepID=UPI0003F7192D|nr:helix-turn-helix domain-containing protein [Paenibacillus massiliensis]
MDDRKFTKEWPHELIKKFRSRPVREDARKKMRQVDLAAQVGVDPRTVQQWENGDRIPSIGSLKRLIQVFLEEGHLLEGAQQKEASELWLAVKRLSEARSATHREFPDFDEDWFDTIMSPANVAVSSTDATASDSGQAGHHPERGQQDQVAYSFKSQGNMPGSLPLFIGRREATTEIKELLREHSLVSLLGPGGIGKTSLAIQVAAQLTELYPDGIWLFELGSVGDPDLVSQFLLSTLGLQNQPAQSDIGSLVSFVSSQKQLFIFDNCEHLINASSALAEALLSAAPSLSILVTSREALNIQGEYMYRVQPLTTPHLADAVEELPAEDIQQYEAVQLFLAKARTVTPHFQPTMQSLRLICEICKRLEGIPLAIELAVARMNVLTLEQIVERLSSLLTLLTAGRRTAIHRQQTLKSTIDWSYTLLTAKEQLLLQRLSIFSGGFTLDAAESVCSCEPGAVNRPDNITELELLDLLSSLVNKSLVGIDPSHDHNSMRYSLLESIKEYAAERLLEASADQGRHLLSERYARYYSCYLMSAEAKFRTHERDACLQNVRREYANVSNVLQWAYHHQVARPIGIQMASALYWFWLHEGTWNQGLLWLGRFLDDIHMEEPIDEKQIHADTTKALHGQGVILFVSGRLEQARASAGTSVAFARSLNHSGLLASSLRLMGFIHMSLEQLKEARDFVQESVNISRQAHDLWNLGGSLHAWGKLELLQNQYSKAVLLFQESIQCFEQIQDKWELSGPYEGFGYSALKLGQVEQAVEYFKKSVAISHIYKGTWVLSRSIEGLAIALCTQQAYPDTVVLLSAAEKYREASGGSTSPNYPVEYRHAFHMAQNALEEQEWQDIWNKGKSLTKDQIIAFALET